MRQPDNLPAFCRVHRNGRPLIGMSASWEPASATQIARSGAAATGTPAALVADQIGGAARSNQVQCRSHTVIGLCSAGQYPPRGCVAGRQAGRMQTHLRCALERLPRQGAVCPLYPRVDDHFPPGMLFLQVLQGCADLA